MKRPRLPRGRTRTAIAVATVAGLATGGFLTFAASASPSYRTALAALGDVEQDLRVTGTVTLSGRTDLQFGTGGSVTRVLAVGTAVKKGDVLAQVDTTTLLRSVTIAQASVTTALARLASDQNAKDNPPATPSSGSGGTRAVNAALAAADKACATSSTPAPASTPSTPSTSATSSPTSTPTVTPTGPASRSAGPGPGATGGAGCTRALQSVRTAVQAALATSGGNSVRSATRTVTDADIARDEATVASARTQLVEAAQNLEGATITAPVDGTVAAADVKAGADASAGTTAVTLIGAGLTTVSIDASTSQVARLKVGQVATVTSTLGAKVASGTVTWIGAMPSSSSGSSSGSFPVVVTLAQKSATLASGSPVDVSLQIGSAKGVVTVPTSAVRDGTVTELKGGHVSRVRVTTGLVGAALTQITDGLEPGATVVLADLSAALPTSTVNQGRFGGLGGGGLGGLGGTRRSFGG